MNCREMKEKAYKNILFLTFICISLLGCHGSMRKSTLMRDKYFYYPDRIVLAINGGYIVEGMDYDQVFLALGDTSCKSSRYYKGKQTTEWLYDPSLFSKKPEEPYDCLEATQHVYFENGKVVGWDNIDSYYAKRYPIHRNVLAKSSLRNLGQYNNKRMFQEVNLSSYDNVSQDWVVSRGVMTRVIDSNTFDVEIGGVIQGIRILGMYPSKLDISEGQEIKNQIAGELIGRKVLLRHGNVFDIDGRLQAGILYISDREI